MNLPRPHSDSAYMEFSKLHSPARYTLSTSGVMNCSLVDLGLSPSDFDGLELHGADSYGYAPLLEAIAALQGVAPSSVVLAAGTSMANHLAMSALFAPGDEVLIEEPTYGLLLSTALYLGADVRRFTRRAEDAYALDPDQVARHLTPRTRLIVLSNMHNPSSALASEESLRAVGERAARVGARVLIDEVYLETLRYSQEHAPVASAVHLGPHFAITSSLTKAYGLSGLRCGWILAEPALAERIWRLNDLFAATPVHIGERLSVLAIARLQAFGRRADAMISANRRALRETLEGHPALGLAIPPVGTTAFPRLRHGDVEGFCRLLREEYETSVVPGRFFERPDHFRIGLAGDPAMTRAGLVRIAEALSAWSPAGDPRFAAKLHA
jgi:aspartate/methionine/tyrosine aminotransferase